MRIYTLSVFLLIAVAGYSQASLNNYRYVIVPERFNFSKEDNQYGLSTTTKLLLEQKGFVASIGGRDLPPAVAANRCSALMADIVQKKGFFVTNLTLQLKDCQGNVIFQGKEGKSREKEFPVAYDEALKNAFASLNEVPYKYDSTVVAAPVGQASVPMASAPASGGAVTTASGMSAGAGADITGILYAQPTPNGYQLIDTTPKKVMALLKTSLQDCYIAVGVSNGVVFKKNGEWFLEYYKDEKLVSQKLEIKF